MRRRLAMALAVAAWLGCTDRDPWWDAPLSPSPRPPLALPSIDEGRVLAIWNWGAAPLEHSSVLVVSDRSGTREVPPEDPLFVRWLSPTRALVTVDARRTAPRTGLLRLAAADDRFEEWAHERDLSHAIPSPDGRVAAFDAGGDSLSTMRIEIRRLAPGLELVASRTLGMGVRAWSPAGNALLLSELRGRESGEIRNQRTQRIDPDLRDPRPLELAFQGQTPTRASTLAFAWTRAGIVARIGEWIALCDPDAATCREVWKPERPHYVVRAVPIGDRALLVGLADDSDPVGLGRTAELRRIELASGEARLVFRTPERTYLQDFDWIAAGAPGPEGAAPDAAAGAR
jgi:hypothetical protein